jgi:hypothetical protein
MPLVLNGTTGVQDNSGAFVAGTAVASTSGTSIDFTSIPSWVKRVTVMLSGVSTNGTSAQLVRLGTSGGIVSSGYVSTSANQTGSTVTNSTTGFLFNGNPAAASIQSGIITIALLNNNVWVATSVLTDSTSSLRYSAGDCTLSATLDRIRITTVNGTDTFDSGSINILYE